MELEQDYSQSGAIWLLSANDVEVMTNLSIFPHSEIFSTGALKQYLANIYIHIVFTVLSNLLKYRQ